MGINTEIDVANLIEISHAVPTNKLEADAVAQEMTVIVDALRLADVLIFNSSRVKNPGLDRIVYMTEESTQTTWIYQVTRKDNSTESTSRKIHASVVKTDGVLSLHVFFSVQNVFAPIEEQTRSIAIVPLPVESPYTDLTGIIAQTFTEVLSF